MISPYIFKVVNNLSGCLDLDLVFLDILLEIALEDDPAVGEGLEGAMDELSGDAIVKKKTKILRRKTRNERSDTRKGYLSWE